jgi:hypothetical protein
MTTRTQPSYPSNIRKPRAKLSTQVAPRELTTETPVLLYDGDNNTYGAVVTQGNITHLGNNVATVLRLYTQLSGSTEYQLLLETSIAAVAGSTNAAAIVTVPIVGFDISPRNGLSENTGFRLQAGESIYCALGTAIASGVNVFLEVQEY